MPELHCMFLDLALLTEQQGEYLDEIENQISETNDDTEVANEDLHKSIKHQKAIRRKRW